MSVFPGAPGAASPLPQRRPGAPPGPPRQGSGAPPVLTRQEGPTEPLGALLPAGAPVAGPPAEDDREPDGAAPPRRAGVTAAVLISVLALLTAAAAGLFSWRTFQTVRAVAPAPSVPAPAPERARPLEPVTYPVSYAKESLRLDPACAAVVHLDLDEPRADAAENVADLRYESRCGSMPPRWSLGAGAAGGSRQAGADSDAQACERAIRTSPLGRGLEVEVTKGTALCVLTAAEPAELVLVEIVDVGGSGAAGLRATSWRVLR
ncbi:hypothetical protein [Actinoplanes utahensis]|uniref:hypothetical protein n=1 Tax=Actinoplanes utahensis TaxID=1869 RepID=UPI00068EE5C6|nr:hypothetical protein [Actinoplanes utahensis]GIF28545.1 hypothetical protein Aut01nite_15310 [Actinoplanes utahensis]